ncbi:MAG: hypothetical protein AAF416_06245 [Pseudomonadota bacterium]
MADDRAKVNRREVMAAGVAVAATAAAASTRPAAAAEPLSIKTTRARGVVPFGAMFEAVLADEDELLESEFLWEFGERYDFTSAPDDRRPRRSAGDAIGPAAAHVFVTPGRHTVRLTQIARNFRRRAEITIEARDAAAHFEGPHTLAVSGEGDFSGAPDGAQRLTDLSEAARQAQRMSPPPGGRGGPRARLLLRAGETFALGAPLVVGCLAVDRFGSGADPVITAADGRFIRPETKKGRALLRVARRKGARHTTIANIALRGDYRPDDPAPSPDPAVLVNGIGYNAGNPKSAQDTTLFRVSVVGTAGSYIPGENCVIADCHFADWHFYALYGQNTRHAILGSRLMQHPKATRGPGGRRVNDPAFRNHPEQGPVRIANRDLVIFSRNILRSTAGWSPAHGGFAIQPAIRQQSAAGARTLYAENHFVGGFSVSTHEPGPAGPEAPRGWVLEQQNFYEGDPETEVWINTRYGRHMIRNCVFLADGPVRTPADRFHGIVVGQPSESSAPGPVTIVANTFIARFPHRQHFALVNRLEGAREAVLEDNLVSVEGFGGIGIGESVPGDTSTTLNEAVDARFLPLADSDALKRGTPGRVLIDFFGQPRPDRPSRGAIEP